MKNPTKKKGNFDRFDLSGDGVVSPEEALLSEKLIKLKVKEQRAETQRRMAWVSMAMVAVFTSFLFSPWISVDRVSALSDLLGLFYIAHAGIIGAYMGVQAWMQKNDTP